MMYNIADIIKNSIYSKSYIESAVSILKYNTLLIYTKNKDGVFVKNVIRLFRNYNIDVEIKQMYSTKDNFRKYGGILVDIESYKNDLYELKTLRKVLPYHLDIDCITYNRTGELLEEKILDYKYYIISAIAKSVYMIIEEYNKDKKAENLIIYGRGLSGGLPIYSGLFDYLHNNFKNVKLVNSKNNNSIDLSNYDIVILATGKKDLINISNYSSKPFYIDIGVFYDPFTNKYHGDMSDELKNIDSIKVIDTFNGIGKLTLNNLLLNYLLLNNLKKG